MATRTYRFRSTWNIKAQPNTVWQVLTATPFSWPDWWPELHSVQDVSIEPRTVGSTFTCVWQSTGYRLRSKVIVDSVDKPTHAVLSAAGDLDGTATCSVQQVGESSQIIIVLEVKTTKLWMNVLAPLLNPLFKYNHHAVMRSGERGLRRYIANIKRA